MSACWPDRRILDLFGIELPISQAPMAGATTPEMVIAVCEAGGWGRCRARRTRRLRLLTRSKRCAAPRRGRST
jgi:NAD(P)H-dependent flavin oxidoreductase YrpB (nitropropane dioxygenase family)